VSSIEKTKEELILELQELKAENEILKNSEVLWQKLVSSVPDYIALHDTNGIFKYLNHYADGFSEKDVIGKNLNDFIAEDSKAIYKEFFNLCIETKQKQNFIYNAFGDNSIIRIYENTLVPIIEGDKVEYIVTLSKDITDRIESDQALSVSQERYKTAQEVAHIGSWEYDIVNNTFWGSDEGKRIYGFNLTTDVFSAEEVMKCVIDRDRVDQALVDLITKNIPYDIEFEIIPLNSSQKKIIRSIADLVKDPNGNPIKVTGVLHDITIPKQAEILTNKTLESLNIALQTSKAGTWDWDIENNIFDWSDDFLKIFHMKPDTVAGFEAWTNALHPDDVEIAGKRIQDAIDQKKDLDNEYRIIVENNEIRWIRATGKTFYKHDKPIRMIGLCIDITKSKKAEIALKESEENFRLLFENSPIGVYIATPQGNIIDSNHALLAILGSPSLEATKQINVLQFQPLIDNGYADNFKKCVELGIIVEIELPYYSKWGKNLFLSSYIVPLKDNQGNVEKVFTLTEDITEWKKAEKALSESEKKFRSYIDFSPLGIITVDEYGNYIEANSAASKITGFSNDELLTKNLIDLIPEDNHEIAREHFGRVIEEGFATGETAFIRKDGSRGYWTVDATKISDSIYLGFVVDISERKKAEEVLRRTEAIQSKMVANIGDVIVIIDKDGNNSYKSPNIEKWFGWKPEDVVGKSTWENVHPDDLEHGKQFIFSLLSKPNASGTTEVRYRCKDGRYKWIEITLVNLFHDPDIQGILGNYHDITERKMIADTQKFLLTCGLPGSGMNFFESLAVYLSKTLEMEYVCIDSLDGDGLMAHTVAIYNNDMFESNVTYALKETPCGDVVGKTICCFPRDVSKLFPNDKSLLELNAESYVGTTLWSFDGKPIGLIAIIGKKPMENTKMAESMLALVAMRAAGELERKKSEEILMESQSNLEEAQRIAKIGSWSWDMINNNIIWSKEMFSVFDIDPDTFDGKPETMLTVIHPDDIEKFTKIMQENMQNGKNPTLEYRVTHRDGSIHNILANGKFEFDINGLPIKSIGTAQDITDRVISAEQIKKMGSHYQALIEKATDGIVLINLQGDFKFISPSARKMFGYDEADEINASPVNFTHPDDLPMVTSELTKLLEDPLYVPTLQYRFIDKNGNWKWIESTFSNLLHDPNVESIVINFRDISERKFAEEALRESEEKFRTVFNTMEEGMALNELIYDDNGEIIDYRIIEVNPSFERIAKTKRENAINRLATDIYQMSSEYINHFWKESLKTDAEIKTELHNEQLNTWMHIATSKPINNRFVTSFFDITELKNTEADLIKAKEKAIESDRLKSAFLANMSHEIRTPMNGIIGFTSLIAEEDISSDERKEYSTIIQQSCNRLLAIVNDVLDLSKIEAGQMDVKVSNFSLHTVMSNLYNFYQFQYEKKDLDFVYLKNQESESLIIASDEVKVHQMISILLSNASKFTHQGKVEFGYTVKHEFVEIYVKDTGIGISEEFQEQIFGRFRQEDLAITRGYEGAGLGLSIARGIVQLLGGTINLESKKGQGSTFTIKLPIKSAVKNDISKDIDQIVVKDEIDLSQFKILIAEDDMSNYLLIESILKRDSKVKLLNAEDGQEAVNLYKSNPDIDLVIMDMKMPVMSGFEATKIIKSMNMNLPILAVTAYALSGDNEKARDAGCDDYISKPFDGKVLLNKIKALIKNKETNK
jgi:PAS domain S-box-containing protein